MDLNLDILPLNGRKALPISAEICGELTADDLKLLTVERGEQKPQPLRESALRRLTERHRNLARLIAAGEPDWKIAMTLGYTVSRISILKNDPAMRELVAHFREDNDIVFQEVQEKLAGMTSMAIDILVDRLESDDPEILEKISIPQILEIIKTGADRTGNGPSSKSEVSVNVNIAEKLQAARRRHELTLQAKDITDAG